MSRLAMLGATLVLALHGLIHLLGTAVYLQFAEVQALPYRTTLLGGAWEVGQSGMHQFGALWAVAAIGFLMAAAACHWDIRGWTRMLVGVTVLSLVLTALDHSVAFAGLAVNVVILAVLAVRVGAPRRHRLA